MKASELDWGELPNFSPEEWPGGVLSQMSADLVLCVQEVRRHTGPLYPSPVAGAHVRDSGASRHSTEGGERLSDATDLFCEWRHVSDIVAEALAHPGINGIGLYNAMIFRGGEPGDWAMVHLDARPPSEAACWLGVGREPVRYTTVRPGELMRRAINLQAQHALYPRSNP